MTPPSFEKLSVIIPCYNEEGNVVSLKNELIDYVESLGTACEFIFVDDGSVDGTYEKIRDLQSAHPSVKLMRHPDNLGLGVAVQTGIAEAQGDLILTLDSDLTFHPKDFPELLNHMGEGISCVMGSPFLGGFEKVGLVRKFLSGAVNFLYRMFLGKNLTATSSLFRLYRADVLKGLKLTSRSFDINAEIVSKLIFSGYRVLEVPVTLGRRKWGESKICFSREIKNHIVQLVKIACWRLVGSFRGPR